MDLKEIEIVSMFLDWFSILIFFHIMQIFPGSILKMLVFSSLLYVSCILYHLSFQVNVSNSKFFLNLIFAHSTFVNYKLGFWWFLPGPINCGVGHAVTNRNKPATSVGWPQSSCKCCRL